MIFANTYFFWDCYKWCLISFFAQSLIIAQNGCIIYNGSFFEFGCIFNIIRCHSKDLRVSSNTHSTIIQWNVKNALLQWSFNSFRFILSAQFEHRCEFDITKLLTVELKLLVEFDVIFLQTFCPDVQLRRWKINIVAVLSYLCKSSQFVAISLTFRCRSVCGARVAWACAWYSDILLVSSHFGTSLYLRCANVQWLFWIKNNKCSRQNRTKYPIF